jgi:hypothetical protein
MQFNDITGCDAYRLADCLVFADKCRLNITEHTQAGVNTSSGNVWLWDEDWPACIYQTINGKPEDVCFSWSCPNCGDEVDCMTVKECEDLNGKFNEIDGCIECKGLIETLEAKGTI